MEPITTTAVWPLWFVIGVVCVIGAVAAIFVHAFMRSKAPKAVSEEESKVYVYPLPVRLWHWGNALIFIALLLSGLFSHFGLLTRGILKPVHILGAVSLMGLWAYFFVMNIITGNIKHYFGSLKGIVSLCAVQLRYYLYGIFRGEAHPFHTTKESKFNPLQQITYIGVTYIMIPALIITGTQIHDHPFMKAPHLGLSLLSLIFIAGHVYLSLCGSYKTQYIKGMIDGYHRETEKTVSKTQH